MIHTDVMDSVRSTFDDVTVQDRILAFQWAVENLGGDWWPKIVDMDIGGPMFRYNVGNWRIIRSLNADGTDGPIVFANCIVPAITEEEVRDFIFNQSLH